MVELDVGARNAHPNGIIMGLFFDCVLETPAHIVKQAFSCTKGHASIPGFENFVKAFIQNCTSVCTREALPVQIK